MTDIEAVPGPEQNRMAVLCIDAYRWCVPNEVPPGLYKRSEGFSSRCRAHGERTVRRRIGRDPERTRYGEKLAHAGFEAIDVEPRHIVVTRLLEADQPFAVVAER